METRGGGSYRQKALDLRDPPTLPRHVLVYRARGIEEVQEDFGNSDEMIEDSSSDSNNGEDLGMRNHGDS